MDERIYREYVAILKEELQPAMGCTEPIAVAYCAALAHRTLGALPETVEVLASANIIKNVKSVIVPNTNGQRGIAAAAAAGIVSGNADAQLQVLASLTPEQVDAVGAYLQQAAFTVRRADKDYVFDIQVRVTAGADSASVEIAGYHTNVIRIEKNGVVQFHKDYQESGSQHATDRSLLTVEHIIAFANEVDIADVQETLQRQIDYNWAIAEEGLRGDYGANIGRILLQSYGMSIHNRAKAYAAAGSDARMNGCDLPVVINSGSGNQGLTASLPVIVYARELGVTQQMLYRALVVSNLVTIHLKTGIGSLSAYCGATAAGCGAAAGVTYLYGGQFREIARVAGLLPPSLPGRARRTDRQLQASSGLLFDVLQRFDPDHLLLEQARREVLEAQLDVQALRATLAGCAGQSLALQFPASLTPLAFPLWAEASRGALSTEDWGTRMRRAADQLEKRHG